MGEAGYSEVPRELLEELQTLVGRDACSVEEDARRSVSRDHWALSFKDRVPSSGNGTITSAVVRPSDTDEVSRVVAWANRNSIPIVPFGAGSGVLGGIVPVAGGITLDLRGMSEVEKIDGENLLVTVGAGLLGSDMEEELKGHGYTVGHYPQSLYLSSVGGWVAARGSGTFSSLYGNIEDMVAGLEVVLPDGTIIDTKTVPRSAAGPDLKQLFIGSEGTLGIVTRVTLRMWLVPERRAFRAFAFPSFGAGLESIREIFRKGYRPAVVRLYDPIEGRATLEHFGHEAGECLLVLAFDGTKELVELTESEATAACSKRGGRDLGPEPGEHWEQNRFNVSWFDERIRTPGGIAEAIEVAHVWDRLEETFEKMSTAIRPHVDEVFGHVSHVYPQGASLYVIFRTLEADDDGAVDAYRRAWDAAMGACLECGATISHHHGVGLQRAPWMASEHGEGMTLLKSIKCALDPENIMNPGKLGF